VPNVPELRVDPVPVSLRDTAITIAERLLYKPYIWSGDDPLAGFDCSGFCIEVLQSVGRLPPGDWTAAELAAMWGDVLAPRPGCLVFWNRGSGIGHVEIVYQTGPTLTIGASGGGSSTTTFAEAVKANAYIKIRPIKPGWVRMVDPFV